jgi:hypothetical protein
VRRDLAAQFDKAAEKWWKSIIAEPHSFEKTVYLIGLKLPQNTTAEPSNAEAGGVIIWRRGTMMLSSGGAVNFTAVGDYGCWKIRVSCAR